MSVALLPELKLDNEFPEELHILFEPFTGKYACYNHNGVNGVASFATSEDATLFSTTLVSPISTLLTQCVTFDEARLIAQGRPMPIIALFYFENYALPPIATHYVK